MVVTELNNMTLEELEIINEALGVGFFINDGKIVDGEEIPTAPTKAK